MPYHNYHLPNNTKTGTITRWKLETTAKVKFVYVSLLKQKGNIDFGFISVRVFGCYSRLYKSRKENPHQLPRYNFVEIIRFEDGIVLFSFDSSFYMKKNNNISIENRRKMLIKIPLNKYSHCLLEKKININA